MSKIKVTLKKLKSFNKILSVGYCSMQHLLKNRTPNYYNSGLYGWNCDSYIVNDVLIVTGYRGVKGNINNSYEVIKQYEDQARNINCEEVDQLLYELLEVLQK